ncbi:GDSL-type esterase/lipase family protein [Lactiplantibacillus songbeiensis]|uniref:GDSL-type esterase/lipase family protein n=2 Tax=Lactiplantibacillus songbeiensis TaxID=2559920 RepID=A0ABW4C3R0_9LACO
MTVTTAWRQMVANFPNLSLQNMTGSQTIQVWQSLSAPRIRLELANDFGKRSLPITSIQVGSDTLIPATWHSQMSFLVPAHQRCWTDWLDYPVTAGEWLTITIRSPEKQPVTLTQTLDQTLFKGSKPTQQYFWGVDAIQVERTTPTKTIMCFGDSLTNQGYYAGSLMQALALAQPDQWGLINGGISGNRLLRTGHSTSEWVASFGPAGIERLPQLLAQQPVDVLVAMAGLNDLLQPGVGTPLDELPTAADLIAGLQHIQRLAAQKAITLTLLTITPFKGAVVDHLPAWSPAKEQIRQAVNTYLRTQPVTIDLASYVADSMDNCRLAAQFDCGDATHFSAAGGHQLGQWLWQQLQQKLSLTS